MIIKISSNGKQITSVEEWFNAAPPKGEKTQWKVGRSAMEMARFAVSDDFSKFISTVSKWAKIDDTNYDCEPEAKTTFNKGMGSGGPRNHDLLMVGDSSVIGIEAKVSESFDKQISEKRIGATDNMHTRLDSCLSFLYGEKLPNNAEQMYYQLFSATIGTIIEAQRRGKKKAVVLFLTFTGNVSKESDYNDKVAINEKAFMAFCNSLGLGEEGGKLNFIPGLGDNQIDCFVKSVKVEIAYNYGYK